MKKGERLTAYLRLGALLVRDKKHVRAEALYKSCIAEFEDDFRCYFNFAQLRCLQKRYAEAELLFLEAETRNQIEVTITNALSGLLLILGQPSRALKYCEKGLTIDPDDSSSWYNLNICLRQLDRMGEAILLSRRHIAHTVSKKKNALLSSKNVAESSHIKASLGLLDANEVAAVSEKEEHSPLQELNGNSGRINKKIKKCEIDKKSSFEVIFVCLKFGTKYGAEYVNNLYLALEKNTADYYGTQKGDKDIVKDRNSDGDGVGVEVKGRFRFVCYTESAEGLCDGVEVHPLPVEPVNTPLEGTKPTPDTASNTHPPQSPVHYSNVVEEERHYKALVEGLKGWKGWWYKAYLFHAAESLDSAYEDTHSTSPDDKGTADNQGSRRGEGIGVGTESGTGKGTGVEEHSAQRWICYFDLDTVFGGSLDFLFQLLANETKTKTHTEMEAGTNTEMRVHVEADMKFFTLGAAHFPCEGRPCGINSSVMMWQPGGCRCRGSASGRDSNSDSRSGNGRDGGRDSSGNRSSSGSSGSEFYGRDAVCSGGSNGDIAGPESIDAVLNAQTGAHFDFESIFFYFDFESIFFYLFKHYEAVTKCVYKFDHYLEIILLPTAAHSACPSEHLPSPSSMHSTQRVERAVRVIYLQDLPGCEGKIIDFSSLFSSAPRAEEGNLKNSQSMSSCGDTGEHHALSCPPTPLLIPTLASTPTVTLAPPPALQCNSNLTLNSRTHPNPIMASMSTLPRPTGCENSNTERSTKSRSGSDMDENMDMDMLRGARVICFPLTPKPHQAAQSSRLIKHMWTGQSG